MPMSRRARNGRPALFRGVQVPFRAVLLFVIVGAAGLLGADGLSMLAFSRPLPGAVLRIAIGAVAILLTPKAYRLEVAFGILFFAGLRGCAWIADETLETGLDGARSRLQPLRVPLAVSLAYLALPVGRLYVRKAPKYRERDAIVRDQHES
jgi:hypothetical protein